MEIRRGRIRGFDRATYTATVEILGSFGRYLTGVPVAHHIALKELIPGRECGVVFFDEANQVDGCVAFLWSGQPEPLSPRALPSDPHADDDEFLADRIGTWAAGNFWEWVASPTSYDVNGTWKGHLYVKTSYSDSAHADLKGNITTPVGDGDEFLVCLEGIAIGSSVGQWLGFRLEEASSGYYGEMVLRQDAANICEVTAFYESGSGRTEVTGADIPVAFGHQVGEVWLKLKFQAGATDAFEVWLSRDGYAWSRVAVQSVAADWAPDEVHLFFGKSASASLPDIEYAVAFFRRG